MQVSTRPHGFRFSLSVGCCIMMGWGGATSEAQTSQALTSQALTSQALAQTDSTSPKTIRIATYNVSLYGKYRGQIAERLSDGKDPQAEKIAAVIQWVRPDVLLLNEIDYDPSSGGLNAFADHFLAQSQDGQPPMDYPYRYGAPSNTGVDSGLDIDGNGKTGGLLDAWGFGRYEGQYSFAILSRFPIDLASLRSFQEFKWCDLPSPRQPIDPGTGASYYSDEAWNQLRLSSKNHLDVPIQIHGRVIHLLASHPTPPVFDGKEDRNGCRNHDEIRFWSLYLSSKESHAFRDDQGRLGGLAPDQSFVLVGDLNSDPHRGDSIHQAIVDLIEHPRTQDPAPRRGAGPHVELKNSTEQATPNGTETASFSGKRQYRIDYVLPSKDLQVVRSGVYWPAEADAKDSGGTLAIKALKATDHRMVWVEVELP